MRLISRLAIALLVAGCGGATTTVAPTILPTEPPVVATPAPTAVVTPAPTVAPSVAPTGGLVDGVFTDPEGAYRMRVDPAWTYQAGGIAEGIEFWFLGPAENGFRPNLNALTQRTGGMSIDEYIDVSIKNGPATIASFKLVDSGKVEGENAELGFLEFTGTGGNDFKLRFLAYFVVRGDSAIVVTLTAPATSFKDWRAEVEPFVVTLEPT